MLRKDHYLTLGIPHGETSRGIQGAFRELEKHYHPDPARPEVRPELRDIEEAYRILSDPERRKAYNDQIIEEEAASRPPSEPISSRTARRAEPLVPEPPMSLLHGFESIQPSFEPLYDRFVRNFTGQNIPKGERLEALNVEVSVASEAAAQGLTLPLGIPVFYACRRCGGSGHEWLFPCAVCGGRGLMEGEARLSVAVPSAVRDRTVYELPVHHLGIHNFYVRLHIRIAL